MHEVNTGQLSFEQVIESEDFERSCTSGYCREALGRGSHVAHWLALFTCGHDAYWCHARKHQYETEDLPIWGTLRCMNHEKPQRTVLVNAIPIRSI